MVIFVIIIANMANTQRRSTLEANVSTDGIPDTPVPFRRVNDFAIVFTPEQRAALEQKLKAYDYSDSVQIAVVVTNDLKGFSIDDFAYQLFNKWGIGYKKYKLLIRNKQVKSINFAR